ncbi:hypothetical protein BLNAU_15479 [Blattamonas nauphoetae]|uniref:Integral membrane protein n=1 Tax=Blattamonas nauphoetae TaxID=2049346 RepID=A0ABQ9XDY7_9EUKA|nr:hypothetical protein BLNAU_15479 [Blattamonas nauphoetae]
MGYDTTTLNPITWNIYGAGAFPTVILSVVCLCIVLALSSVLFFEIRDKIGFSSKLKKASIVLLLLDDFLQLISFYIPVPFRFVANELMVGTIPTFLYFGGFVCFSLWTFTALGSTRIRLKLYQKILVALCILSIFLIRSADTIITLISPFFAQSQTLEKLGVIAHIVSASSYILLGLIVSIAGFRMIRILRIEAYLRVDRWRIVILIVLTQLLGLLSVAQFIFMLLDALDCNPISDKNGLYIKQCMDYPEKSNSTPCLKANLLVMGISLVFILLPSLLVTLVLMVFTFVKPTSHHRSEEEIAIFRHSSDPRHQVIEPDEISLLSSFRPRSFSVNDDIPDDQILFNSTSKVQFDDWTNTDGNILGASLPLGKKKRKGHSRSNRPEREPIFDDFVGI